MTKDIRYLIFGKTFSFSFEYDNEVQERSLLQQLEVYPVSDQKPDVIVNFVREGNQHKILQNPGIHEEFENGFSLVERKFTIKYRLINSKVHIDIIIKSETGIIGYLKKLYNIGYESIDERSAQIVNELVLVPSVYFDKNKALIHSSGFITPEGKALLIGGTGGVGKTSLELELCLKHDFVFVNDDIGVIDNQGRLYPNLAFPKIYSYNLEGNRILKERILNFRPLHDKFAWHLKKSLFGASKVRRKISPKELFGQFAREECDLSAYFVLIKSDVQKICMVELDKNIANEMTLEVIKTEYANFHSHLSWHKFNSLATGRKMILDMDNIEKNWKKNLDDAFINTKIFLLQIPFEIEHKNFLEEAAQIIKSAV